MPCHQIVAKRNYVYPEIPRHLGINVQHPDEPGPEPGV